MSKCQYAIQYFRNMSFYRDTKSYNDTKELKLKKNQTHKIKIQ